MQLLLRSMHSHSCQTIYFAFENASNLFPFFISPPKSAGTPATTSFSAFRSLFRSFPRRPVFVLPYTLPYILYSMPPREFRLGTESRSLPKRDLERCQPIDADADYSPFVFWAAIPRLDALIFIFRLSEWYVQRCKCTTVHFYTFRICRTVRSLRTVLAFVRSAHIPHLIHKDPLPQAPLPHSNHLNATQKYVGAKKEKEMPRHEKGGTYRFPNFFVSLLKSAQEFTCC